MKAAKQFDKLTKRIGFVSFHIKNNARYQNRKLFKACIDFMASQIGIWPGAAVPFRFLDRRMGFSWMDCALLLLTWNCLRVKLWKIGKDYNGLVLMKPKLLLLAWWWSRNIKLNEAGEVCELERLIQRLNWTFVFYRHNLTKARHIFKRQTILKCKDIFSNLLLFLLRMDFWIILDWKVTQWQREPSLNMRDVSYLGRHSPRKCSSSHFRESLVSRRQRG